LKDERKLVRVLKIKVGDIRYVRWGTFFALVNISRENVYMLTIYGNWPPQNKNCSAATVQFHFK
jgi:mannose-6-phosphate isomerase-like protein (cupin superfamily)